MTTGLRWETVRSTRTKTAVYVNHGNAEAVAAHFGGTVQVVPGVLGGWITRIEIGPRSGPVGFWIADDGTWLRADEWDVEESR